jgi:hypothetical protein
MSMCIVPGCQSLVGRHGAKGMCGRHYQRVRRYGDPLYVTPEEERRANNRAAQPHLGKLQPQSYPKLHGRHEHRRVAETKLGRPLLAGEIVHHIDGDKSNNHPSNLEIVASQADHARHHMTVDNPRRRK